MARRGIALVAPLLLCAACSAEHTTVVASPAPRAVVVAPSDAELITQSRAACDSYGLLRGSAPFDRCVANEFAARRPG
jgi:hypothetical protein